MTSFYLLDDDSSVTDILEMIIDQKELGTVCGSSQSAEKALGETAALRPDIIIADFLMPGMDGVEFVKKAARNLPDSSFIMLSQVDSKSMISKAYDAGIEFFIRKPINSIEVIRVINNVKEKQSLKRTVNSIQNIFQHDGGPLAAGSGADNGTTAGQTPGGAAGNPGRTGGHTAAQGHSRNSGTGGAAAAAGGTDGRLEKLDRVLLRLGISNEKGSRDIIQVVDYCCDHEDELRDSTLKDIFSHFTNSPKSMEQRIRRTAATALSNVAHIGLADYADETFDEFSGTLFKFEQVYKEIEYIKGKSPQHGNVQIKRFIAALVRACQN